MQLPLVPFHWARGHPATQVQTSLTGYFTGMDIPVEKASADTLTSGYQGPSESAAER